MSFPPEEFETRVIHSHGQDIHRMHNRVTRAIASLFLLLFGLVLSGCSWNLSSVPLLNKLPVFQEEAEVPVKPHHRFVRVTPEPITPLVTPEQPEVAENNETEQSGKAQNSETGQSEITTVGWQIPVGETVEQGPSTPAPSEASREADHEDKGLMPTSIPADATASAESIPVRLTASNPAILQATSRSTPDRSSAANTLDSDSAVMKAKVFTPKPEKVIRVHLASLGTQKGANSEWRELSEAHLDLLGGTTHHIKEVNLRGKGTYFRLYAGQFLELKKADALCKAMKTRNQYCKPVSLRD
jgi:hypothetical protein